MVDFSSYTDDSIRKYVLQQLPAVFNQLDDSNNQKLLNIIAEVFVESINTYQTIYDNRDLDTATDKVLDDIGADWGIDRIDADDDFYRFLIRLAKVKSRLGVTENDLIHLISYTLGADPTEFTVETRLDEVGEVEAINVLNIPNKYNKNPRKTKMLTEYLQQCVAAEVRIANITFQANVESNLYIASYVSKIRHHVVKMDTMFNREHEPTQDSNLGSVVQRQYKHYVKEEG